VLVAHEGDLAYEWAVLQSAQWYQVRDWMLRTLRAAGVEPRMGLRSYSCFVEAGLRGPTMTLEATVVGGDKAPAWGWANLLRGALSLMERLKVATTGEVDPDSLADRLLADVLQEEGIVIGPPLIGAWSSVAQAS
jgi:hypothetical protein